MPASVFISYSHKDERLRNELATHLTILQNQKIITFWHDRKITAGSEWGKEIDDNLCKADLILLLVSPDFLASEYCNDIELKLAMDRHRKGEAIVIPIILKPVDWKWAPFAALQACPTNGKAVTKWSNRDEAFTNVLEAIRLVAQRVEAGLGPTPASSQLVSPSTPPEPVAATSVSSLAERSWSSLPPEPPEGTVPLDSPFYVPWPSEARWLAEIEKPGALIRIKSPNNMGKSSLMARVLAHAKQGGSAALAWRAVLGKESSTLKSSAVCRRRWWRKRPQALLSQPSSVTSHSRRSPSAEPDTILLPSGLKARAYTSFEWPSKGGPIC
jgi:hypothetical protein